MKLRQFLLLRLWNLRELEYYLNQMSMNGYQLEHAGLLYHFSKNYETRQFYHIEPITDCKKENLFDYLKHRGWNFCTKASPNFYIFVSNTTANETISSTCYNQMIARITQYFKRLIISTSILWASYYLIFLPLHTSLKHLLSSELTKYYNLIFSIALSVSIVCYHNLKSLAYQTNYLTIPTKIRVKQEQQKNLRLLLFLGFLVILICWLPI